MLDAFFGTAAGLLGRVFDEVLSGLNWPDWGQYVADVTRSLVIFREVIPPVHTGLMITSMVIGFEAALIMFWFGNWLLKKLPFIGG